MAEQNYATAPEAEKRRQERMARRNSENETAGIPQPIRKMKKSKARNRGRMMRD